MMKIIRIALACCLFFVWQGVRAVTIESLYQVELPVSSQSPEAKMEAIKEGFSQVMVKVSGNPEILQNPLIKSSLDKADYYVQEYGYSPSTTNSYQYQIQIKFEERDINHLLKKAQTMHWDANRPLTLVWLSAPSEAGEANIISNEDPHQLNSVMKEEAQKLGLPLIFPVMDMKEMDEVAVEDITSFSVPLLKKAGERYAPDAMIIGNISSKGEEFESDWQLIYGKNQWDWRLVEKTPERTVKILLNKVGQALAGQNETNNDQAGAQWFKVEVTHVTERNGLEALIQYLNRLNSIEEVRLTQVAGSQVQLSILIRNNLADFEDDVKTSGRMTLLSEDKATNRLVYQWAD